MTENPRRPEAIPLDDEPHPTAQEGRAPRKPVVLDAPPPPLPATVAIVEKLADRNRRGIPWGRLLAGSLGALFTMALSVWIWSFIDSLFARYDWLGWTALGLSALAVLAVLAIVLREVRAVMRLGEITTLRNKIADAGAAVSLKDARNLVHEVEGLYSGRTDLAAATAELGRHRGEIMDGVDLVRLAERDLMGPLDLRAKEIVSAAAGRVSVVTAVSPRALVDVGYVLWENARLISRIAAVYGGRPGRLNFFRLARRTITHLAVTSSIALGDSLLQQVLGHGLTAKLSARLGEGVINGLLTARVGLAAIDVCRPMPFSALPAPSVSQVMGGVLSSARSADRDGET
ncbi:MAG: TIGR01620 family protein [Rhodobiaceae bacterium]|nr:TIGR01620 family protein [Rhodobiaceae bacterium]